VFQQSERCVIGRVGSEISCPRNITRNPEIRSIRKESTECFAHAIPTPALAIHGERHEPYKAAAVMVSKPHVQRVTGVGRV
jgi:hypothetical protein